MTVSDVRTDLGAEEVVERTPWPAALLGLIARYPLGAAGALVVPTSRRSRAVCSCNSCNRTAV